VFFEKPLEKSDPNDGDAGFCGRKSRDKFA
jgi:hypothetical protein